MRFLLVIVVVLGVFQQGYTQNFKKEKRIYVLDVTKSMFGLDGTPDIFDQVRKSLYQGIESIDNPETEITVITFQGTSNPNLPTWTFHKGDGTFEKLKKTLDSYTIKNVPGQNTDIYSALKRAQSEADPNRINYIYLLTDGGQSPIRGSVRYGDRDLENLLNNWCKWATKKDAYLFYVMLTKDATNPRITSIVEQQCRAFVSEGTNINIAFVKPLHNNVVLNLEDEPEYLEIELSANNWKYIPLDSKLKIEIGGNRIFKISESEIVITDNKIQIPLDRFNDMNWVELRKITPVDNNEVTLTIISSENVKILSPSVVIKIKNKKEKVLKLEFIDK